MLTEYENFYEAETEQKQYLESELNMKRELKKILEINLAEANQDLDLKESAISESKKHKAELQSLKVKLLN